MAAERFALAFTHEREENSPALYIVRLLAFLVIIAAMVDKNLVRP